MSTPANRSGWWRMAAVTMLLTGAAWAQQTAPAPLKVRHSQNTDLIALYDVFEITFEHPNEYAKPYLDVNIEVTFTSPGGRQVKVGGFLYGSMKKPPTFRVNY